MSHVRGGLTSSRRSSRVGSGHARGSGDHHNPGDEAVRSVVGPRTRRRAWVRCAPCRVCARGAMCCAVPSASKRTGICHRVTGGDLVSSSLAPGGDVFRAAYRPRRSKGFLVSLSRTSAGPCRVDRTSAATGAVTFPVVDRFGVADHQEVVPVGHRADAWATSAPRYAGWRTGAVQSPGTASPAWIRFRFAGPSLGRPCRGRGQS